MLRRVSERFMAVESSAFTNAVDSGRVVRLPLGEVCRKHWRELTLGTCYMLATYVLFYLMTTFSLSYGRAPIEPGLGQLADGSPVLVGIYLSVAGAITLVALMLGKETKDTEIHH